MTKENPRKDWMGTLAKAPAEALAALWQQAGLAPDFQWLRRPEIGAVMVQGRTGATGAPFCLGEMTVTRASVRLASGEVGHAVVQGRDRAKAEQAALADALLQSDAAETVKRDIIAPLAAGWAKTKTERAAKAAATKVDFFTMVRGED
ncbi:PhnG protein [Candidatus Rhodobacter oscarellae]|uniref:PhnG protein n=1 Tax=Candidatus Rhodobacter oscarellae TaxID=1675527 RepID=A0A0J9E7J5_9RHOB|nr:phosphonate C-P lyase system protein PhnG [Candidatus Rhodobacter lobularis]KMW58735.1 PhnG protein [Candidatus Rhodobacter lobularis]